MDFDGRASPTRSVASTIGSGYASMASMPASWKAGPVNVLLQCEALCQQILGAVKVDVLLLDFDVAAHQGNEQDFSSKATVRLPSL